MTCSHFYDSELSFRSDFQKGERDTYTIIEIAFCCSDTILHGENLTDKFLSRGLSVGTCQCYDSQWFSINYGHRTMPSGEILQSPKSIIDLDKTRIVGCRRFGILVHDSVRSPCLKSLESILVSVEIFSLQGKEHFPALQCTRIRRYRSALPEFIVYTYYFHLTCLCFRIHLLPSLSRQVPQPRPIRPSHILPPPSARSSRQDSPQKAHLTD